MEKEIVYFSDVLCIWAYISEKRVEQLRAEFAGRVRVNSHFCSIFGSVKNKMKKSWNGDNAQYSKHVLEIASRYEHINVHPDIWTKNVPTTSFNAHLVIKAVQILTKDGDVKSDLSLNSLILKIRESFFLELKDISDLDVLFQIAESLNISSKSIQHLIQNGEAVASLSQDLELASQLEVRGSPSFVMNEGRQKLYGNIGYLLIKANVEEYLCAKNNNLASWC